MWSEILSIAWLLFNLGFVIPLAIFVSAYLWRDAHLCNTESSLPRWLTALRVCAPGAF
jgi:hypothetical protein